MSFSRCLNNETWKMKKGRLDFELDKEKIKIKQVELSKRNRPYVNIVRARN